MTRATSCRPPPRRGRSPVLITAASRVCPLNPTSMIDIPSMNLAALVCGYVCVEGNALGNLAKVPQLEALLIEQKLESCLGSAAGRSRRASSERTASAIHH